MSNPSGTPDPSQAPGESAEDFDPYYKWLGIPPDEQPPNRYRLLGLKLFETDHDVIESAADRQMAHLKRFAGGRRAELSQRLLNEVSEARACLLDTQAKLGYDTELRKSLPSEEEAAASSGPRRSAWPDGQQPKNLDEFLKCLAASRLYTRTELDDFITSLPAERRPNDPAAMAKELVQSKKLTKYQAACIYQGRPFHLLFGKYEVIDRIGVGGMGQVYRARHRQMDRLAAVKVLSSKNLQSKRAVERFRREVKMAAQLDHKNIVQTYDADDVDGEQYLVMEFVEGRDMAAILKEQGPLSVDAVMDTMIQAARGLEYIHSKGITHRDIKPGNLMQAHDGTVQISDLGLARLSEDPMGQTGDENAPKLTMPGQIIGTVDYMSPEQAVDTHSADARSDIYSLGCTMYRLITGKLPYPADSKMQKLLAHRGAPIPSIRDKRPEVSEAIDAVFQRMVAKEPADRYQTVTDLIAALENAQRGGPPVPVKRPEPRVADVAPAEETPPAAPSDAGPLPTSAPAAAPMTDVVPGAPVPGQATPQTPAAPAAATAEAAAAPQSPAVGEPAEAAPAGGVIQTSVSDRISTRGRKPSGSGGLSPMALAAIGAAVVVILVLIVLVIVLLIQLNKKENGGTDPGLRDTSSIEFADPEWQAPVAASNWRTVGVSPLVIHTASERHQRAYARRSPNDAHNARILTAQHLS